MATSLNTMQHHPTMLDDVATIWLGLLLPLFPTSSIISGGITLKYKPSNRSFFFHFIFLIFRWNRIFGNNALTAPVEEIDFRPGKKGEFVPRAAAQRDDGTPLACIKGGPNCINAYKHKTEIKYDNG